MKKDRSTLPPEILTRARRMRHEPTKAESVLWKELKAKRLERFKFRRQEPVVGYIADFLCYEHRLVIEVDGGHHVEQVDADALRTRAIEAEGFRVIRFWNNEIMENLDGVLEKIVSELKK